MSLAAAVERQMFEESVKEKLFERNEFFSFSIRKLI
jgi:hypothetical protein